MNLRDIPSGKGRLTMGKGYVDHFYFTFDGKSVKLFQRGQGWLPFYNLSTGKEVKYKALDSAFGRLDLVSSSPDRKKIAVVSDGTVKIHDALSGELKHSITFPNCPPRGSIQPIFAPDGRHLITVNGNGTVYVLRLAEPTRIK